MTLESDAKIKEKMTRDFKYDMRNLRNLYLTNQMSESFFSMRSFSPKYTRFEVQKYRGVIFYDTEQWCKISINSDLVISKMAWEIRGIFIKALKQTLKRLINCTLMGFLCPKHIMFQLETFIRIISHDAEGWCKIKTN